MFTKKDPPKNCSRLARGTQKADSKSPIYYSQKNKNKFGVAKVRIIGIKRLEKKEEINYRLKFCLNK
jgi:hypothetical protein